MEKKNISRAKAAREKCLDCCCWDSAEVRRCSAINCPLHPFRMGTESKTRETNMKEKIEVAY